MGRWGTKREDKMKLHTNRCVLEIADEIHTRRKERKMTQQSLADASGLDRQDITRLENLRTDPTLAFVVQICDALNCDVMICDRPSIDKNTNNDLKFIANNLIKNYILENIFVVKSHKKIEDEERDVILLCNKKCLILYESNSFPEGVCFKDMKYNTFYSLDKLGLDKILFKEKI